jgi:hypothetical protein
MSNKLPKWCYTEFLFYRRYRILLAFFISEIRNTETRKYGISETRKLGNTESPKHGISETRKLRISETQDNEIYYNSYLLFI